MDLDGDGQRDLISGSWPGALYFFKGNGQSGFSEKTTLKDKEGKVINIGQASVVHAGDFDGDGDIDLVIGCINGSVFLVANESGSKALAFGAATKIEANGKTISTHHSAPLFADWDGDGTLDLIVGQGDGSVAFYKNAARKGVPKLAAAEMIVQGTGKLPNEGGCGSRVKPHVTDWNGDGRLDLLLGDFNIGKAVKRELTDEQEETLIQLRAEQKALMEKMSSLGRALLGRVLKSIGVESADLDNPGAALQSMSEEQRKAYGKAHQEAADADEGYQTTIKQLRAVGEKLGQLQSSPPLLGNVWVYLRSPPVTTTDTAD